MARKRSLFLNRLYPLLMPQWAIQQGAIYAMATLLGGSVFLWPALSQPTPVPVATVLTSASDGLAQGKAFYEAGQYTDALRILQKALQENSGDRLSQAVLHSNLSLTHQQLGQWPQAEQSIQLALTLLRSDQTPNTVIETRPILAQALEIQGQLQLALAEPEQALQTWVEATQHYTQIKDPTGQIRSQLSQTQAMQALGLNRRALKTLDQVHGLLQSQPDSLLKAVGLRRLGEAHQTAGDLRQSHPFLQQSLEISQRLQSAPHISAAFLSLGNTARAQEDFPKALQYYQQASNTAPAPLPKVQAQLNQLSLFIATQDEPNAHTLWPQIQAQILRLTISRPAISAQINLAESLLKLDRPSPPSRTAIAPDTIPTLLKTAIQQAKSIGDLRSEAYGVGILGQFYEQAQQWSAAEQHTQTALLLAQSLQASDIAYRWHWQLGRIRVHQGQIQEAIAAYTEATRTLKSLRSDIASSSNVIQFSFRESIEPVYRELVRLLLLSEPGNSPSQQNLQKARETIEALQLAEVVNFLQVSCLDTNTVPLDAIAQQRDPTAAVVYPIVLPDRVGVILKFPQQDDLQYYSTTIDQKQTETILQQFGQALSQSNSQDVLQPAQIAYQWLIRPIQQDLVKHRIKTLVFVLDGEFRNVPMAALHDGQQYLVERYSIALAPGLQLLAPTTLNRGNLNVFAAGLTEAIDNFPALPAVAQELAELKKLNISDTQLLNQSFTRQNFQQQIETAPVSVVHLATHGQFSSNPDATFLLAYDERIRIDQLDSMLRTGDRTRTTPLELLVLSACETLKGDKRASLGIAGVSIKAGARSTLATLWLVSDNATSVLMRQFYESLRQESPLSKADALRQAQLALLQDTRFKHPYFWSPYVLLGNWL